MTLNVDDTLRLLNALEGTSVTELQYRNDGFELRITRWTGAPSPAPPPPSVATVSVAPPAPRAPEAPAAREAPAPAPPADDTASGLVKVNSPIVGTFYRAPDPNSPVFVNVGDRVRVGQVLCIVEAMKLMNEIEAETAGEIVKIYPENGQPVQYGDPLFALRPER